jgi:ABC-type transporter Mla subunit MlaD
LINGDAKKLIGSANEIAGDAKTLMGGANRLLAQHEADLNKTLDQLPEVLGHLDTLLGRTQGMLTSNEKDLNATIRDLRVVMQEMRLTAVNAKKVMATLANGHPTRLIWTKDDEPPPSDAQILRGQLKPAPPASPRSTPATIGAGKR